MSSAIIGQSVVHTHYFLNLFRPITVRPTKPVPRSKYVAGSGTGEGPPSIVLSVTAFETKVDAVELVAWKTAKHMVMRATMAMIVKLLLRVLFNLKFILNTAL
jgi:hypothetical protein